MILRSFKSALILDKPAGMSTHTPDSGVTAGFTESAERLLGEKLWAVHRLDRDTSGCIICSTSSEGVEAWSEKLKASIKKYVFISPNDSPQSVWSFEGRIEKVGSHKFDLVDGEVNSKTTFAKIGKNCLGYIYEAEISTGKTHQIRIHAQKSGLPILGDPEHGGKPFHRLMLHSWELTIDNTKIQSPLPIAFLMDQRIEKKYLALVPPIQDAAIKFMISFDRRRFLMAQPNGGTNAFRLCHREWFPRLPIVIEKLGDILQVMTYSPHQSASAYLSIELLDFLADVTLCSHWFLRQMVNRGNTKSMTEETDLRVQAS